MPVLRRSRLLPSAVLVGAVAAGGVLAPSPAPAVAAAAPAAVRLPAAAAPARTGTRLTVAVTRGPRATLSGVLSTRTGRPLAGRTVRVHWRAADTGVWRSRPLRTTSEGRVRYRVVDRPNVQFTLRFAGDSRYGPAASAALVPAPSATGLSPALVRALGSARTAARRAGVTLVVNSGYRTRARQQALYDAGVRRYGSARAARRWVLPPTESTHVRGLAVDVGPPASAAWLATHGARWGFCRTYASEPWHLEYRPGWVRAFDGSCPPPVATPGDPDPLSPRPRVPVR